MRLALLVSIPVSCFFDQQALHDKNSKRDILGVWNWDWKISKQSLSISEHCKKTTYHTKWPSLIFLNLSRAFYMFGRIDIKWVTFMRAGGRDVNSILCQWEVPACLTEFLCWYTPELDQDSLSQWPTFKLLRISYVIGKIKFKLLFHGPLAEYISGSLHTMPENEKNQGGCHTKKTRDMFQPSFSKAKCQLLRPGQSGVLLISPSRKNLGFSA